MSTAEIDLESIRKKPGRRHRASQITGSDANGGGWKKRRIEALTCPSGQQVQVRRPGPEFTLRAGKVARTFSQALSRKPETDQDAPTLESGLEVIATMTDDEFAAVMIFARELVCAILISPRLVQNPQNENEIGPDDIGDDFWFLFNYAMTGFFNLTVPVGNQEVEVSDLKSFRPEPGVSRDSSDRSEIRPNAEQPPADT